MDIYGRDGKPITMEEFQAVPKRQRKVKEDWLIHNHHRVYVLTEWDGTDVSHGEAPVPMPFSTFVAHPEKKPMMFGYPDQEHAEVGHAMMIAMLKTRGCKGGIHKVGYFFTGGSRWPRTPKMGWIMLAAWALCLLLQGLPLVAATMAGTLSWMNAINAACALAYGYLVYCCVRGLRWRIRKDAEERRKKDEKETFDAIVQREWT